ncbi:MAG: nucleotide exchange factor GrpE [Nanoarchaeota archaeon]
MTKKSQVKTIEKKEDSSKQLELKLKETEEKINLYINDIKRLQAEFENHIKRSHKEKESLIIVAKQELTSSLLPIIDDFERALKIINEHKEKESISEGMQMIFKRLYKTLEEQGLRPINSLGKRYDPFMHEVIKKVDSDLEEDTVVEEIQKGYLFNNNLLRPAKVIISNGKKSPKQEEKVLEVNQNV